MASKPKGGKPMPKPTLVISIHPLPDKKGTKKSGGKK
jgi:hypothetical protein